MAVYGVKEEAINVIDSIDKKIMEMNQTLDDVSAKVNRFTQQDWISDAAEECKLAIDKRVMDSKKYFMEIQTYLTDLTNAVEKSFQNETNRDSIVNNL